MKSIEVLFAQAGHAEANRRQAEQRLTAARQREIDRANRRARRAEAMAPASAERVWRWLAGADAETLRQWLRASGLEQVDLLAWVTRDGRALQEATYGAWRVSLVAEPSRLWIERIGLPTGGRSRAVDSPAALLDMTPAEIVVVLERALASGRYVRTVQAALRERMRPDALPANIVRIR
jgi:hypothetical protein